ncbi:MAG: DUF3365 domain-containing protein [Bacteroidetes bacterium]|nr:DUF3365 domain-containing protein [Bacteroidota bacterium]
MKDYKYLLISAVLVFIFSACINKQGPVYQPSEAENERIIPKGEAIAMSLIKTLKGEVKQAIDSNGVVAAISVCNDKAIPLTSEIENISGKNISIKRTSFKFRNPVNEPDEFETAALNHFEKMIASGSPIPAHYTQKVVLNGDTSYYYYKPMKMEALCLLCHGTKETVPPSVQSILSELYPADKATGYEAGDFRGLIRVKMNEI